MPEIGESSSAPQDAALLVPCLLVVGDLVVLFSLASPILACIGNVFLWSTPEISVRVAALLANAYCAAGTDCIRKVPNHIEIVLGDNTSRDGAIERGRFCLLVNAMFRTFCLRLGNLYGFAQLKGFQPHFSSLQRLLDSV